MKKPVPPTPTEIKQFLATSATKYLSEFLSDDDVPDVYAGASEVLEKLGICLGRRNNGCSYRIDGNTAIRTSPSGRETIIEGIKYGGEFKWVLDDAGRPYPSASVEKGIHNFIDQHPEYVYKIARTVKPETSPPLNQFSEVLILGLDYFDQYPQIRYLVVDGPDFGHVGVKLGVGSAESMKIVSKEVFVTDTSGVVKVRGYEEEEEEVAHEKFKPRPGDIVFYNNSVARMDNNQPLTGRAFSAVLRDENGLRRLATFDRNHDIIEDIAVERRFRTDIPAILEKYMGIDAILQRCYHKIVYTMFDGQHIDYQEIKKQEYPTPPRLNALPGPRPGDLYLEELDKNRMVFWRVKTSAPNKDGARLEITDGDMVANVGIGNARTTYYYTTPTTMHEEKLPNKVKKNDLYQRGFQFLEQLPYNVLRPSDKVLWTDRGGSQRR